MSDLAAGANLAPFGRSHDLPGVVQEFATTLRAEMDYRREGRNADRLRPNFAGWTQVYVPKVYWEYSTPQVLVLERIRGIKIDVIAAMIVAGVDRKAVALYAAQVIVKEVLEDGFFHADPHPGNFVVMPGDVLGVMDFGMVGTLDEVMRLDLARIYIAAVEMSTEDVVNHLLRMGVVDEDVDRRALVRDVGWLLDKYRGMSLKELRASEIVGDVIPVAYKHRLHLPPSLWLLGKTLSMLEGVGLQLDPDFDIFVALRVAPSSTGSCGACCSRSARSG
jgi:ubiquinone biosynthesis protein